MLDGRAVPLTLLLVTAIFIAAVLADTSDEHLLERITNGDEGALGSLYDRHVRRLYSLAARIAPREADAEEVVQDVFVRVWTLASRYDPGRGSVIAWLLIMTRSRALDRVRALRARPDGHNAIDPGTIEKATAADDTAEHHLIGAERAERVRSAFERLSAPQREAIDLAYYGGLTHTEIAARLREPLGTVKTRVRAALMKLRDALEERA